MPLKLLALTNLFPSAWDPQRSPFNRQQFERLAARDGVEVDVLTAVDMPLMLRGRRGDPALVHARGQPFGFLYPPRFGRPLHPWFWLHSLLLQRSRWLHGRRFDCLLGSWAFPDGVATAKLATRLGLPYAIKVHGSDINVAAEQTAQRRQIATALAGAGAIIAVSRALAEKLEQLGADPARVHVLYNGVDTTRFRPASRQQARARLGLPASDRLLLFVGNLKRSKGCIDLVQSMPALLAAQPHTQLRLVGDGPDRAALARAIEDRGLDQRVRLVGRADHEQLADWYHAADLLCLPSHNEGVPNVILEAMACGIPVVATRVGGIPEVLPECAGLLVDVNDSDQLVTALVLALQQSWDTDAIVAHAGGFCWDDNVERLHAILRQIVGHPLTSLKHDPETAQTSPARPASGFAGHDPRTDRWRSALSDL